MEAFNQLATDTVLLELEVVQIDVLPGLLYRLEESAEFYLGCGQDGHLIVLVDGQAKLLEVALRTLGGILGPSKQTTQQDKEEYERFLINQSSQFWCKVKTFLQ